LNSARQRLERHPRPARTLYTTLYER